MALNKSDIIRDLKSKGFAAPEAVLDRILEVIAIGLRGGETVSIRNFGKWEPRVRAASIRKNPKSGAIINVPEKIAVGFVASNELKDRING